MLALCKKANFLIVDNFLLIVDNFKRLVELLRLSWFVLHGKNPSIKAWSLFALFRNLMLSEDEQLGIRYCPLFVIFL